MANNTKLVSSPTCRRRKQSILTESHPNIAADEGDDFKDNTFINNSFAKEVQQLEHNLDNEQNSDNSDESLNTDYQSEDMCNEPRIPDMTSENNLSATTDIVYNNTMPKSPHASEMVDIDYPNTKALRESINFLISPDDECPKRRRQHSRRESVEYETHTRIDRGCNFEYNAGRFDELNDDRLCDKTARRKQMSDESRVSTEEQSQCDATTCSSLRDKDVFENTRQYNEHSSERSTQKISSSVQRPKSKTEQITAAAANRDKKHSSDARLLSIKDKMYIYMPPSPRRKTSSDAILEHGNLDELLKSPKQKVRTRKVSFDTTALYNGYAHKPLNDEVCVAEENDISGHDNTGINDFEGIPTKRNCMIHKQTQPRNLFTIQNDFGCNRNCEEVLRNEDTNVHFKDECNSECENKAYLQDENESKECSMNSEALPLSYTDIYGVNDIRRNTSLASPQNDYFHGISNTELNSEYKTMRKSSLSLPPFLGRRLSSVEEYPPTSILKVRRDDADSMGSEDSTSEKSFKLRKDSIALFMDQKGDVGTMGELKKQNSHRRFSKKDIKRVWTDRKMILETYILHLIVLVLFLLTLAFVVVGLYFHRMQQQLDDASQNIVFDPKTRQISLTDPQALHKFTGRLGQSIPSWRQPTHCYPNFKDIKDTSCLKWENHGQLDIAYFVENDIQCYNISWSLQSGTNLYDCFDVGDNHWYGPVNVSSSEWPIKSGFTFSIEEAKQFYSSTLSPVLYYWLSSDGKAVVIDSNYSLETSWNKLQADSLCIIGKNTDVDLEKKQTQQHTFQYTLCSGSSIIVTHQFIRKKLSSALDKLPDRTFLTAPQWSTMSESDILNETIVLDVVESVSKHKLSCSSVEIDGHFESKFGELLFNTNIFQNVSNLVEKIKVAGCDVSLNIYPLFYFLDGLHKSYLARDDSKQVPEFLRWQSYMKVAMSDISNPAAGELFQTRIKTIAIQYNITTFRLSYGISSWMPHNPIFHLNGIDHIRAKQMISNLKSATIANVLVESSSKGQHITTLVGIPSSVIVQGEHTCLRNILPDIFTLGLLRYPFVMSDGFALDIKSENRNAISPSRDLFIRWMQLSSFFPAMRYTAKPWSYDVRVIELSKNLTNFHSQIILDAIFKAEEDIKAGVPIIKALWWDRPEDKNTFTIDDEFMVTDKFLVAPILCECNVDRGTAERSIYIPKGVWRDMINGNIIVGPKMVQKFKVALFDIPYFEKIPER